MQLNKVLRFLYEENMYFGYGTILNKTFCYDVKLNKLKILVIQWT